MLRYLAIGAIAAVLALFMGIDARSLDDAQAFEDITTASCEIVPMGTPADPIRIGPTGMMDVVRHEINGNQAMADVRIYPVQSDAQFVVTEPMISGTMTFDTNTAQFQGNGEGTYFNPSIYTLQGTFGIDPATGAPTFFDGQLFVNAIEGNQPNLAFSTQCDFPDLFSIVVLKLDDDTSEPISGWLMELYDNEDCSGDPIDSALTDGDGLIDFVGLLPGIYSVLEEFDPLWEPDDGNLCREDIEVGPLVTVGTNDFVDCPVQGGENAPITQAGCDSFDSGASVTVEFVSGGDEFNVSLNGPTTVHRLTGPQDVTSAEALGFTVPSSLNNGLDEVETKIIQLDLTGTSPFGPITVRQSSERVSNGIIEEMAPSVADGTMDFEPNGAWSFFNVYVEIDIIGFGTLHNVDPIVMHCIIFGIPPYLCLYFPPIGDPIELYDEDDILVAWLIHAAHVPLPFGEEFEVFRNIFLGGGEKLLIQGDFDCDEDADAVDALVVLAFIAGQTPNQGESCPLLDTLVIIALVDLLWGDVDCDGDIDAVDALKILQFLAGLPYTQEPGCPTILDP